MDDKHLTRVPFSMKKREQLVSPEGAMVALPGRDGKLEIRPALGVIPTLTRPAQTKSGGNRKSRRKAGKH